MWPSFLQNVKKCTTCWQIDIRKKNPENFVIWIEQLIEKKTKNRIKKPRFNDDAISVQQIFGSLYSLFRLVFKSTSFSCNWFVKFGPRKTVKEKLRSGKEKNRI